MLEPGYRTLPDECAYTAKAYILTCMVYDGRIDANVNSDVFVPMIILPYVRSNCSALPCIHTDGEYSFFCRWTCIILTAAKF